MPTYFLCALVVCAAAVSWAQGEAPKPPASKAETPTRKQILSSLGQHTNDVGKWTSLGRLADVATRPDRSLAAPAAELGSQIAHRIDAFDLDEREIPAAELRLVQQQWLEVADETERWVDIRVYALDVAAALETILHEHGDVGAQRPWLNFLKDPDPQMRAAAVLLVPQSPDLVAMALTLVADGRSEEVSLAAGQRLCGPLGSTPGHGATLSSDAMTRLQRLASNTALPSAARADLAPCLLAEGSLASRRALGLLLQKSPPALRQNLRNLIHAPTPRP